MMLDLHARTASEIQLCLFEDGMSRPARTADSRSGWERSPTAMPAQCVRIVWAAGFIFWRAVHSNGAYQPNAVIWTQNVRAESVRCCRPVRIAEGLAQLGKALSLRINPSQTRLACFRPDRESRQRRIPGRREGLAPLHPCRPAIMPADGSGRPGLYPVLRKPP